jgi:uncharacterized protein YecA (UPF0149 family)
MEVKLIYYYDVSDDGFYGDCLCIEVKMNGSIVKKYKSCYDLDCARLEGFLDALKLIYGDSLTIKKESVAEII